MQTPLDRPDTGGQISFRPSEGKCCRGFIRIMMTIILHWSLPSPGQGHGAVPKLRRMIKRDGIVVYMSRRMTLETCNQNRSVSQACAGSTWRGPAREKGRRSKTRAGGRRPGLQSKTPHRVGENRRRSIGKTGTARTKTEQPGLNNDSWNALNMPSTLFDGETVSEFSKRLCCRDFSRQFNHVFRRNPHAFSMSRKGRSHRQNLTTKPPLPLGLTLRQGPHMI